MSASFTRSIQAIQNDGYGRPVWFVIAGLIMILWVSWALIAEVNLYERSADMVLTSDDEAEATFAARASLNVAAGQTAQLHLDDFPANQYGSVVAVVESVDSTIQDGTILVTFRIAAPEQPLPLQAGLRGEAEVIVARVSPMTVLFRVLGLQDE